ncbi:ABC transporter ATP-binding protein [Campylobacter mucosalis]|uniref:ABC transporter ATP-binding protein n=1 Tax=Campylobacter mucosalis TaxID=202 RepID=UPI0014705FB5|nr:ATP-binding cassette domain-containing protein [Campylobacter mucosalis]
MISIDIKKPLNGGNGEFLLEANIQIQRGEFVCIYGSSGSGKTTLLRLLAGFEQPQSGSISVFGKTFFDNDTNLAPQKRNIGFLFQDYALFENMSVMQNLMFAKRDKLKADELLELMDLGSLKNANIATLSGGQKQRLALARALMRSPEILLLDEPLSALDSMMREKLQEYLQTIHKIFGITIILISHDVSEIYRLCSKVFVLEDGKICKTCTPRELFLKTSGSKKLAFNAKILEIYKSDVAFVALVLVQNQLCKVVLSNAEASALKNGDEAVLSVKAFGVSLAKIGQEI